MTNIEREIVELIAQGYSRSKIAHRLGLGDTTVRRAISRLCEEYQCSQRELPEKVKEARNG